MGPSTPLPSRERIRNARREAMLEAAEQVFAEKGFAGATVAEIAARAGYSAGNLYNVFENKEALFREVVRSRGDLALERLQAALADGTSLGETIERFVHAALSFFEEQRAFFAFYIQATSGLEWNVRRFGDDALRVYQDLERRVERLIRAAEARGEIPPGDALVRTCAVLGTLQRFVAGWIQSDAPAEGLWSHERALIDALRCMLGVEP